MIDIKKQAATAILSLFLFANCSENNKHCKPFLYPQGATSLHIAVAENNVDAIPVFIEQGANPLAPDIHGVTPFDIAQTEEIRSILLSSLQLKAFIEEAEKKGYTRILSTLSKVSKKSLKTLKNLRNN